MIDHPHHVRLLNAGDRLAALVVIHQHDPPAHRCEEVSPPEVAGNDAILSHHQRPCRPLRRRSRTSSTRSSGLQAGTSVRYVMRTSVLRRIRRTVV